MGKFAVIRDDWPAGRIFARLVAFKICIYVEITIGTKIAIYFWYGFSESATVHIWVACNGISAMIKTMIRIMIRKME